jgi:peptide/nickel transport system substrate-binding protein
MTLSRRGRLPRGAVCNQPWVKGMTQMVNGIYNGSRFEDVWIDK